MNIQEQEERDFTVATDSDWDRAEAYGLGAEDTESAWILTDRDVWHANPFYQGPPVPHPEDDYAWRTDDEEEVCDAGSAIEWPETHLTDEEYEWLLDEL